MKSLEIGTGRVLGVFLALLVAGSAFAGSAAAAELNYQDGKAPNPYYDVGTVTVENWDNAKFDSPLEYYDDSGNAVKLGGEVNRSTDVDDLGTGHVNALSLTATDVNATDFSQFPRKSESDNSASALDASEWTTSGTAIAVSDVTTAPNVPAVEIATSGMKSGYTNSSTYSNFSITSDAEKRYIQLAADVNTLESGATANIQFVDSDGDYVEVDINGSADESAAHVLANSTGTGDVTQVQVGKLSVYGSGDGVMNEITKMVVKVNDADIDADFALVNAEKTSKYTFGEKYVDTDSEDDLETETIHEPHGEYSIHHIDTLGSVFSEAAIKGLSFPAHVEAKYLGSEDTKTSFESDNAYPNWDTVADIYYRMTLPDAYDLSYSSVDLKMDQKWPSTRYVAVETKEGSGDTAFSDIDNWNGQTGSFDQQDKTVTLDSTISPGTSTAVHISLKLTGDEAKMMRSASDSGGAMMGSSSGGGLLSFFMTLPGMIIAGVGAFLGGRRLGVF